MGSLTLKIKEIPEGGLEVRKETDRLLSGENYGSPPMGTEELGVGFTPPVRIELKAELVGETVLLRGSLAADFAAKCDRCLCGFEKTVGEHFELAILKAAGGPADMGTPEEKERELTSGELDELLYYGDEVDLEPLLYEQLVLALPDVWICRPDCKGICPGCGTNLNEESCKCENRDVDPRFESLKKLKF